MAMYKINILQFSHRINFKLFGNIIFVSSRHNNFNLIPYTFIKHNYIIIFSNNIRYITNWLTNNVKGIEYGHIKWLIVIGIGYKVLFANQKLIFKLGFSHFSYFPIPTNITVTLINNKIKLWGTNFNDVALIAKNIRILRKPDPYKGKGISYRLELIKFKVGKQNK